MWGLFCVSKGSKGDASFFRFSSSLWGSTFILQGTRLDALMLEFGEGKRSSPFSETFYYCDCDWFLYCEVNSIFGTNGDHLWSVWWRRRWISWFFWKLYSRIQEWNFFYLWCPWEMPLARCYPPPGAIFCLYKTLTYNRVAINIYSTEQRLNEPHNGKGYVLLFFHANVHFTYVHPNGTI